MLPQASPPPPGSGGSILLVLIVFVGLALIVLIRGKLRPKHLPPPKSPEQAKAELEEALRSGAQDVRGEAHLKAFLSWSRLWALLEFVGFALFAVRGPEPAAATHVLTALSGGLWLGLWRTGRAVRGGADGARVLYAFLATALGLALAFTLAFDPRPWAGEPRARFIHGLMVIYTLAGATYLFHPRCARLFTAEYREAAAKAGEVGPEAQSLALFRSPFSWVPIVSFLSSLLVQFALEKLAGR